MKRRHLRALATYLRICADLMELRDWTVVLDPEPPSDPDAQACVKTIYGQKRAIFKFRRDFDEEDADYVRHVVTHELVHVPLDRLDDVIQNGPCEVMGRAAFAILDGQWSVAVEHTTDHLTRVIEGSMPVIDWDWIAPAVRDADKGRRGRIAYEPWLPSRD